MDDSTSSNIHHQAISAALEARWDDALKLNKKIIKLDPQSVDGLARLARAYMEMGRFNLAKKYYSEALKYDPYNPIASKNLKIIKSFKSNGQPKNGNGNGHGKLSSSLFLQEPGKSKIINLLKVAEPQKLSQAYCGMQVGAAVKNRKITIVDEEGTYLGVLPDDICHHLMRLLRGGNKYEFFIKSVRVNSLSLLIRETFRSRRFKNQPSFLESSSPPHLEMITAIDDEDEEGSDEDGEQEA